MNKKQVTLADLAQQLGISTATVSRALKDYPDISQETKKKVLELARELKYRPNSMAAGLRKRESHIIGVIIPSIVNHFFSSVIKGIMEVAYEADYRVMLCQTDESYAKEIADTDALFASRVDGLLVSLAHETQNYDHFDAFRDSGIPMVFFDKVPLDNAMPGISKVVVDDYQGAFTSVEHLIQQGCTCIAHFHGPLSAYTSVNRYNGYKDALKKHGLPQHESLLLECKDITFDEGREFVSRLREVHPECDGIFTVTDAVGMGAMMGLKAQGVHVPHDIAVIGFSDWQISAIVEPHLSSIAQPSLEMGRRATQLLLKEIHANKEDIHFSPKTEVLQTQLKVRASSKRR
ncbi:MAG: LacI family DNA-binding transcriptional regulator [Bacteroidota bacterium]